MCSCGVGTLMLPVLPYWILDEGVLLHCHTRYCMYWILVGLLCDDAVLYHRTVGTVPLLPCTGYCVDIVRLLYARCTVTVYWMLYACCTLAVRLLDAGLPCGDCV